MRGSTRLKAERLGGARRHPAVAEEADEYSRSVAGVDIEAVRVGRGVGPNLVLGVPGKDVTLTSSRVGFPMTVHAQFAPTTILAAHVKANPNGSRWCGVTPRAGSVIVYPPGAEHVAVNHPGLEFTFAITELDRLMAVADHVGAHVDLPSRPCLVEISPSDATRSLGLALDRLSVVAMNGEAPPRFVDDVHHAFTCVLAGDPPATVHSPGRGIDSRSIVGSCLEYVETIDRLPSIAELCRAANVSERRLRSAFSDQLDQSPAVFFRRWALNRANRRLRSLEQGPTTVTDVAVGLGFGNLGRFASYYQKVYGESPSTTLRGRLPLAS